MPLPGDVTTITVTAKYEDLTGGPLHGSVTFTAQNVVIFTDVTDGLFLEPLQVTATLDGNGAISTVLPTTDASVLSPEPFSYMVTENIAGVAARSYSVSLPHTLGSTVNLVSVTPVPPVVPSAPLPITGGGTGNTTGQPSGAAGGALSGTYPNPGLALEAGMQFLTGGGVISASTVTAAQAAGFQGIFLDPRFVWNAAGLSLVNVANFTIESRMSGSIGYSATISYNTGGYISTGSGTDGIQVYGTTGAGATGITFRGVSLVGSNTNAVLHLGGRHRRIRVEDSFIYNTNSAAGAYGLIDDTQLNNGNGEDNCLDHVDIAGAYAAIGIGIADQTQHVNDSLWQDITTWGGTYAIVANAGGNHQFVNFYDRSQPSVATVWNHGAHLIFIGGENGNNGVNGGITYLCDTSGGNTVLRDATITAGGSFPTDILHLSSGNFSLLGKMRSNNACALVVTGGTLFAADPASGLANVTISGSGGAVMVTATYMGSGNAPTITWSGTPVILDAATFPAVEVSQHANTQTAPVTVSWTPPAVNARFRVSIWLQVTVAGTSTVPVLSFAQYSGTAFSQTLPMWQMNSAATAPTYTCAAQATYAATFMGETDLSATAVALTITPTGSTYRYSVVIERLS